MNSQYWLTHHPTTNTEICALVPNCKFFLYSDLWKVKSLNELLPKSIILYQLAKTGHWVGIFENNEGINFYDPLGYAPDDQLDLTTSERRKKYNQNFTYLLKILSQTSRPIIYNDKRLQASGTSTCGMHVTHRLNNSHMTDEEYYERMIKIKNRDLFVANYFETLKKSVGNI